MHEYSIVSALLEQCDTYASTHNANIDVVVVGIGICSAIEPKLLQSAFETFKEESAHTRDATLQIEIQPVVLRCGACRAESEIADTCYGTCPKCQSQSVQIIQGRDMLLLRLEMLEIPESKRSTPQATHHAMKDQLVPTPKDMQKELVKDIAKRANTLNLQDIQEGWQLAGAIADRQAALQKELQGYKDEILASQATLKSLRAKVAEYKDSIAALESKERQARQELAKVHDEISIQNIIKESKLANEKLQESRKQILPGSLKSVQIYLKDGSIAKAKPAQKLFGEDVYKKYRVAFKENHTLKSRISELELENKRLHIELRDFYSELALEGMGALESNAKDQSLPEPKEIIATDEDLSDFKKMLKAQKKTKE